MGGGEGVSRTVEDMGFILGEASRCFVGNGMLSVPDDFYFGKKSGPACAPDWAAATPMVEKAGSSAFGGMFSVAQGP